MNLWNDLKFDWANALLDLWSNTDLNALPQYYDPAKWEWQTPELPPGWNGQKPRFWDRQIGYDQPLCPGEANINNVVRFFQKDGQTIEQYKRFRDKGCTYGQWWLQGMGPAMPVSFYTTMNIPNLGSQLGQVGMGLISANLGYEPCPFASSDPLWDSFGDYQDLYLVPYPWDFIGWESRQFKSSIITWWWVPRLIFYWSAVWQKWDWDFPSINAGMVHSMILTWVMAFMYQHRMLVCLRKSIGLPVDANDDWT